MIKIMEPKKQIFTHQEKKVFLEILKNYSRIVEIRHTHSSALKAKNIAWQKITSEFNACPQASTNRTTKQLRRLWMNLKHRQRDVIAKTHHQQLPTEVLGDITGSKMVNIAHALITGVDSSMDSDIVLETTTNDESVQTEPNLYLSEESQNMSNQQAPVFSSVKIEPMSPIIKESIESTPIAVQNLSLLPNNKAHIPNHENSLNQDNKCRLLQDMEIQLLKEKLRGHQQENKSREENAAAIHNLEYNILKEKLREAKAKADLAELYLKRQQYSND